MPEISSAVEMRSRHGGANLFFIVRISNSVSDTVFRRERTWDGPHGISIHRQRLPSFYIPPQKPLPPIDGRADLAMVAREVLHDAELTDVPHLSSTGEKVFVRCKMRAEASERLVVPVPHEILRAEANKITGSAELYGQRLNHSKGMKKRSTSPNFSQSHENGKGTRSIGKVGKAAARTAGRLVEEGTRQGRLRRGAPAAGLPGLRAQGGGCELLAAASARRLMHGSCGMKTGAGRDAQTRGRSRCIIAATVSDRVAGKTRRGATNWVIYTPDFPRPATNVSAKFGQIGGPVAGPQMRSSDSRATVIGDGDEELSIFREHVEVELRANKIFEELSNILEGTDGEDSHKFKYGEKQGEGQCQLTRDRWR
ncbi:hypothetical protein B0H11DRAFT_2333512 [Mycena galericulata]|nr:hypothetical protein B0H11DRAFT_2333512 [Mycena galericulata]